MRGTLFQRRAQRSRIIVGVIFGVMILSAVSGEPFDFKKTYSAFGEVVPHANTRKGCEEMVAVTLKDFEVDADGVREAYQQITVALAATDYPYGMSLIMNDPGDLRYDAAIKIPKATRTLGEIINILCEQADLRWDFSSVKVTFHPNAGKAEK